jgi:hypothetical protein
MLCCCCHSKLLQQLLWLLLLLLVHAAARAGGVSERLSQPWMRQCLSCTDALCGVHLQHAGHQVLGS